MRGSVYGGGADRKVMRGSVYEGGADRKALRDNGGTDKEFVQKGRVMDGDEKDTDRREGNKDVRDRNREISGTRTVMKLTVP